MPGVIRTRVSLHGGQGIQRRLYGVFELADRLLGLDHRVETGQLGRGHFELGRAQVELIGGACLDHRFDGLDVLVLRLEQCVELSQLLLRGGAGGQRTVDLADDLGLEREETCGRLGSPGLGLGDWSLVAMEEGQEVDPHGQAPLVQALVVLVARTQTNIRVLSGDFELEGRLARGVVGQSSQDIGPAVQRPAAHLCQLCIDDCGLRIGAVEPNPQSIDRISVLVL